MPTCGCGGAALCESAARAEASTCERQQGRPPEGCPGPAAHPRPQVPHLPGGGCWSLAHPCDLFSIPLLKCSYLKKKKCSYFTETVTSCGKGSKWVD